MLQVPKTFTLSMLKANYKRLALQLHPDKANPTSVAMFQILTACYRQLVQEHDKRQKDAIHQDLKSQAQSFIQAQQPRRHKDWEGEEGGSGFNANKFNRIFDENRIKDVYSATGYEDWMNHPSSLNPDQYNKQIVVHKEPEALQSQLCASTSKRSSGMEFQELGVDRIKDFSGANNRGGGLQYMDYRVAHTTTKIMDPELVKQREEFQTIEALEAARANLRRTMTEEEQQQYYINLKKLEEKEKRRLHKLTKQDSALEDHYQKVNHLMISQMRRG